MTLEAHRCPNGHVTTPAHPRCPECAQPQDETIDLTDHTAEIVTWTTSTATPPGVRQPNHLAIVEFSVEKTGRDSDEWEADGSVRTIGQLTTGDVEIGDEVRPVYVEELRDPDAGIREAASQDWDGYRFEPV
ncbi:Zn-ribbon domain-containing OB-fold protein [Haladaptatus sp. NG-SE-30]